MLLLGTVSFETQGWLALVAVIVVIVGILLYGNQDE